MEIQVRNMMATPKILKKKQRKLMIKRFLSNRLAMTGFIIIVITTLIAILAPVISPYTPLKMSPTDRLMPPNSEHIMGTDHFGRDIYTRTVYGIRSSLIVGFMVAVLSNLFGTVIGLYAAYYRTLDHILMRICDGLMAFPAIMLAIAIVASMGPKISNVIIALTIVFTPTIARVIRSAALVVREQTYIEAMKAMGAKSWRIVWMHIFPNVLSPLIVQTTFVFAVTIIVEAALSFLGAGVPAPSPSLGNILYDGKSVIQLAWWVTVFPGLAVVVIVFGLNLFGDGLRDVLDPHDNK
ncbi:peptide ABC transporter permease [Siminovitchia terrae]|uniref:Peptide ABC transporter permease n=1 Tax=Siminovitchia terrae TaxID=1914933 RepID=A0ABQ4KSY4_SIMTE|nr:ABC transporter permease [Siminovitchia terrae]GIN94782.1 peptide ABC transporter permease [Siminovitchia terrae]